MKRTNKYNLSNIMKRAWEIKKKDKRNIFSICLKMAWEEAKMENNKKVEIVINKLIGTEKQIKWARDVIKHMNKNIEDALRKKDFCQYSYKRNCYMIIRGRQHTSITEMQNALNKELSSKKKYTNAEYWIDSRMVNGFDFIWDRYENQNGGNWY